MVCVCVYVCVCVCVYVCVCVCVLHVISSICSLFDILLLRTMSYYITILHETSDRLSVSTIISIRISTNQIIGKISHH